MRNGDDRRGVRRRTVLAGLSAASSLAALGARAQTASGDTADADDLYASSADDPLPRNWETVGPDGKPKPPTGPQGAWTRRADMLFPMQQTTAAALPFESRERGQSRTLTAIVLAGGLTPDRTAPFGTLDAVQYYVRETGVWARGPKLPERLHHLDLVAFEGQIWAVGGYRADKTGYWQITGQTLQLAAPTGTWRRGPSVPLQAEGVVGVLGGYLVYAGGRAPISPSRNSRQEDHRETDLVWRMRRGGGWERARPMRAERASAAGAVVDNEFYVFGGVTPGEGVTNRGEAYDPYADRWRTIRPMPRPVFPPGPNDQSGMAAAAIGSNIYVMGGERFTSAGGGALSEVFEYDTVKDTWRSVAAMPRPRHGMGAVAVAGEIFVAGGSSGYGLAEPALALDTFRI